MLRNNDSSQACHFGMHWTGDNAGDVLLYYLVKRLFADNTSFKTWNCHNLRREVSRSTMSFLEQSSKIAVVGGGGLFIPDSNLNSASGWQWNISKEQLDRVKCPILVFAVGYNNFRNQSDFSEKFDPHLRTLARKATFIGMRNSGSIEKLKHHLPEELQSNIRYQPCPTIFSGLMCNLPDVAISPKSPRIAVNVAFDRWEKRFENKDNMEAFLCRLVNALKEMHKRGATINVVAHAFDDMKIIPYLKNINVPFKLAYLARRDPMAVMGFYKNIDLTFGMRGHAQMIPFGRAGGIYSLVSHEKMWYFLRDVCMDDCGCEVLDTELENKLIAFYTDFFRNSELYTSRIKEARERCWSVTRENLDFIRLVIEA